jgi:hypothetical protein
MRVDVGFLGKNGGGGIGFDWVYIPCGGEGVYFHNDLLNRSLSSFEHSANWVCFGFVLGLYWL